MGKVHLDWYDVFKRLEIIDNEENVVYGIPKGGMIASAFLRRAEVTHRPEEANILLDDIVDSGATRERYMAMHSGKRFFALVDKQNGIMANMQDWVVFPWESSLDEHGPTDAVTRLIEYIGDDPGREGLLETPERVIRAYDEMFSGYDKNPAEILKTFDSDGYDQIVLLKNIELFSMCEHHMLPFFGKAHVAYIPNGRVIGVSKLARLVDIYARRLQIQERLGEQITCALMEHLNPLGAACIIEAVHMCMRMRGVSKQHSVMVTSSLKGAFFDSTSARSELMSLINVGKDEI